MRLWHYELLPYLPKSQLLAQKRECDLIWRDLRLERKTNHILINYIWQYDDYEQELLKYYLILKQEFDKRGCKFNNSVPIIFVREGSDKPFKLHHNNRYLWQCFYNLQEKFDRGQKDFTLVQYAKLEKFMEERK